MENEQISGLSDLINVLENIDNPPEQNGAVGGVVTVGAPTNQLDSPPLNRQQIPPQHLQLNNLGDHVSTSGYSKLATGAVSKKLRPYIRIVEQPAGKTQRFRYICEGRSAGSIQGVSSTPENRTFPTIEIVGWKGEVKILVSLVTNEFPHKAHPHNLVGRDENFKDGIFKITLKDEPYRVVFNNLGIQCVKKKEIKAALDLRERLEVDPFKQKFTHKDQPSSIDLNSVRLCFQAYILLPEGSHRQLAPVVSEPIFDKKAINELVICRMCSCSAKVNGGDELILLCEKVGREDIKVRFFELNDKDDMIWEAFGEFTPNDIHRQTAIAFKTPRYYKDDVDKNAKTFIQLLRPSDGLTSEPLPFEYYPNTGMRTFSRIRSKLKRKQDLEIFQQILSMDSETTATKYSCPLSDPEQENDDQDEDERSCFTESSKSNPLSSDTLHDEEELAAAKRQQSDAQIDDSCYHGGNTRRHNHDDEDDDYISESGMRVMEIELEVPLINYPAADEATQTSTPMEDILKQPQLDIGPRRLSSHDKITEWMRSSELERFDSLTVENGDDDDGDGDDVNCDNDDISPMTVFTNITITTNNYNNNNTTISTDDDRSLIDILEQVAEIDEMQTEAQTEKSRRGTIENTPALKEETPNTAIPNTKNDESKEIEDKFAAGTASTQASVDIDENFDDTSTYTSLQIAFRNPIDIPLNVLCDPPTATLPPPTSATDENDEDLVVLTNPPAPKIKVNAAQTPPSPTTPTLRLPPRTPSPVPDQMLPPLPPKPQSRTSPENSYNSVVTLQRYSDPGPTGTARRDSGGSSSRPQSQIIIMRTPDQSPTKRQTQNTTPTASPKKKQGFFSRLFSRRKSKADINTTEQQVVTTSETTSTPHQTSATASLIGRGSSKATTPTTSREPSIGHFSLSDANRSSLRSNRSGTHLHPPSSPDKLIRKRKTETPLLLVKRELHRQERKLSSPSPNLPNACPDVSPNYANYLNNIDPIKAEPTLSPNPNQIAIPQSRLSPNDRITTPELPYRWVPSPGTQLSNFNTLSIREQNDATLQQIHQQQQQIQQQQHQLQQLQLQQQLQQQMLNANRNGNNPFISNTSLNDNNNNNNLAITYTSLSPANLNSPTNPFMNSLRNASYMSGGSITPLLPTHSEQNNNIQQPIQLNMNAIAPVPLQSPQLNINAGALQQPPVPSIIQQEQYTAISPIQQSLQMNIADIQQQQQQQQQQSVQPTAYHQAQYQEQIDIDCSDEPLTTSGLIRMIVGAEDFPMHMNTST